MNLVRTGTAAALTGIATSTLKRYRQRGYLTADDRTEGGHDLWDVERLRVALREIPDGRRNNRVRRRVSE